MRTLPGGRCFALVHKGPYPALGRSYARILAHMRENRSLLRKSIGEACFIVGADGCGTGGGNQERRVRIDNRRRHSRAVPGKEINNALNGMTYTGTANFTNVATAAISLPKVEIV